jgi:hypothetical protein
MPAALIFVFARTSRCPIVVGATKNALPMRCASRPRTVCSISGVRMVASMAGWAQTNINLSRSSRPDHSSSRSAGAIDVAASRCSSALAAFTTATWRNRL